MWVSRLRTYCSRTAFIWMTTRWRFCAETGTHVAHCPSSNLKLGSGFARVAEMIERGISVSLGADGAPCNNRLDMFTEMRTAALTQKALRGPEALPALTVLRMATIDGARALGLDDEIGSIEAGKRADLMLLNLNRCIRRRASILFRQSSMRRRRAMLKR